MAEKIMIGWYTVPADTTYRDSSYECAAWYQDVKVPAGKYPVYASGYQYHERERRYTDELANTWITASLPGIVVADDFRGRFCGSLIGGSQENKHVGQAASYHIQTYAHAVALDVLSCQGHIELLPEFEARVVPYEWEGEQKHTYGIFKKGGC